LDFSSEFPWCISLCSAITKANLELEEITILALQLLGANAVDATQPVRERHQIFHSKSHTSRTTTFSPSNTIIIADDFTTSRTIKTFNFSSQNKQTDHNA
jgi:hypothetical protein